MKAGDPLKREIQFIIENVENIEPSILIDALLYLHWCKSEHKQAKVAYQLVYDHILKKLT